MEKVNFVRFDCDENSNQSLCMFLLIFTFSEEKEWCVTLVPNWHTIGTWIINNKKFKKILNDWCDHLFTWAVFPPWGRSPTFDAGADPFVFSNKLESSCSEFDCNRSGCCDSGASLSSLRASHCAWNSSSFSSSIESAIAYKLFAVDDAFVDVFCESILSSLQISVTCDSLTLFFIMSCVDPVILRNFPSDVTFRLTIELDLRSPFTFLLPFFLVVPTKIASRSFVEQHVFGAHSILWQPIRHSTSALVVVPPFVDFVLNSGWIVTIVIPWPWKNLTTSSFIFTYTCKS